MKKSQNSKIGIKLYILYLFITLGQWTLPGCGKNTQTIEGSIRGTLIDKISEEPLAGVPIYFRMRDNCSFTDRDYCWTTIDSTSYVSDELGWFEIDFRFEDIYLQDFPGNGLLLSVGAEKEGYFSLASTRNAHFRAGRDSITIALWPKTYFEVSIKDESLEPFPPYIGIRMTHTAFIPWDTLYQHPLDTTVILTGNPFEYSNGYNSLSWAFLYQNHSGAGSHKVIPKLYCPPHDTCAIEIRF